MRIAKNLFFEVLDWFAFALLDVYIFYSGYKTHLANDSEKRQISYKLRWEIFANEGHFNKSFDQECWEDDYDEHSVIFLVMQKKEPVGTLRLIKNIQKGMALYDFFNVKIDKGLYPGNIVEIGRFVIEKSHRKKSRLATLALLRAAHRYSLEHNINWWTGCASKALLRSFKSFVEYQKLQEYELTKSQIHLRKDYAGYFSHRIVPFMIEVKEISLLRGLWNQ